MVSIWRRLVNSQVNWRKPMFCFCQQIFKNYHPVSLLLVFGKVIQKLIFHEFFRFYTKNDLISFSQSGFKPGDSCIKQTLSITYEIYKSFNCNYEVRGVFVGISKALDKIGTTVSCLNWNKIAFLVIYLIFYRTF